ncbi:hypothetical protein XELAEV_18036200mg [Xenopus laevis]|uniref:Uncharacterized protein n=1 Tax=Xenopus laevis TaxID=8355 RepID=A0A974CIB1_XENLA|nr:hypothetical protein XELAEV_18036200mg [Xenopus laevis]
MRILASGYEITAFVLLFYVYVYSPTVTKYHSDSVIEKIMGVLYLLQYHVISSSSVGSLSLFCHCAGTQ